LGASTLVLASKLEKADPSRGDSSQFVIRGIKVIPNISGNFHRGLPLGIYMQVYNVGTDQTTLRPSVDVQYILTKDGKEVGKQNEDWNDLADNGQSITLARFVDTHNLAPGQYGLEVRINDRVSGQTIKQSRDFTITP
jgi:hypothetical protein